MKETEIKKLVRDNIPEIIEKENIHCTVTILAEENYLAELAKKLQEEVQEFICEFDKQNDEEAIKELADVEEVIFAIIEALGVDKSSFERLREAKRTKNGGFDRRLFLDKISQD